MEGPWKAAGPQRAALGELVASLGWLAGIPHAAGGAEHLPEPNVPPRFVSRGMRHGGLQLSWS